MDYDSFLRKQILRRDFLNGILVATGSTTFGSCIRASVRPEQRIGSPAFESRSPESINEDPRALRGGNLPSGFKVGHWMRDRRLRFEKNHVRLAASPSDSESGIFDLNEDSTQADVIILGSGISGLSAALNVAREKPSARILIIDANSSFGGNAADDRNPPLPMPASIGAAYAVAPYADFLKDTYKEIGLNWEAYRVPDPFYNYYFDDQTPFVQHGTQKWVKDVYGSGIEQMPYSAAILKDLAEAKKDFIKWYNTPGAPTDPADQSDRKFDYLAGISFHDYLVKERGYHPAVSNFYTRFTIDALAGTTEQVNAYNAISFLGAEYHPLFACPGGNSGIARHFLKALIPNSLAGQTSEEWIQNPIQKEALDSKSGRIRIRQQSIALNVESDSTSAHVSYFHEGKFYKATSKALIIATQSHSAKHLISHLQSESAREAWNSITLVPVVVANVSLRSAAPLVDLGLGFNQYWWGSKFWADFAIADWGSPNRTKRDRPTVLTFYGGNSIPPAEIPAERVRVMTRPFSEYEASLREDLSRILQGTSFNFDRDVDGIYLYRWGHGMVYPKLNYPLLGAQNTPTSETARHRARKQFGRISFAGQDVEGAPSIECAIYSGIRTAREALAFL